MNLFSLWEVKNMLNRGFLGIVTKIPIRACRRLLLCRMLIKSVWFGG